MTVLRSYWYFREEASMEERTERGLAALATFNARMRAKEVDHAQEPIQIDGVSVSSASDDVE